MKLLVVNYHYFSDKKYFSGIYPVNKKFFTNQIDELSKYYQFVSQYEIAKWIDQGVSPKGNFCLITFDDGLKEQMQAFKWLYRSGIPAVFYVPVKPLVEKKALNVHKLHHIRTILDDKRFLEKIEGFINIDFNETKSKLASVQYKYDNKIAQKLKYILNFEISNDDYQNLINEYFKKLFGDEEKFVKSFYMDENDINLLANQEMLGNHGYSHKPLSKMSLENMKIDIKKSSDYLSLITNKKMISFSYPFGSVSAVNQDVADVVKGFDYSFALTMQRGLNFDFEDSFLLNRVDTNDAPGGKNNLNTYKQ